MAADGRKENDNPGWPLMNPQPLSTPAPVNSPPPAYAPASAMHPTMQIPKRRPLSSAMSNSTGRQPLSPVQGSSASNTGPVPARKASFEAGDDAHMRKPMQAWQPLEKLEPEPKQPPEQLRTPSGPPPSMHSIPLRQRQTMEAPESLHQPQSAVISSVNGSAPSSRHTSGGSWMNSPMQDEPPPQPLQYHHQQFEDGANRRRSAESATSGKHARRVSAETPPIPSTRRVSAENPSIPSGRRVSSGANGLLGANLSRPQSTYSSGGSDAPRRTLSPGQHSLARTPSPHNRSSPDNRPMSYVDLLNVPYPQPPPATSNLDNAHLRSSVGENASLLSTKKTLDMYRANVKKTSDPTIQYEFAIFMITTAQEQATARGIDINSKLPNSPRIAAKDMDSDASPQEMLREARSILQKLSDRSYPFAQYYLGDGYASGLFNKGNPDNDRAFPLFIAASKHGHAEAGYRAALCYEFGWGCRKDFQKAVQFYRQSASKNHPGAMSRLGRACLVGDMGLGHREREGLKWLKRAAESADFQYNSAPYELGLLHETGYGDDIFKDESYAAQLFTQSADLGHVEANYRLGEAYELGKLSCPKDPALSVHFYTGAASRGHPVAMMALCAWYMIGAEPVLEKDENEAYQWARQAAECGQFPLTLLPTL